MNRRGFFTRSAAALAGALVSMRALPAKDTAPPIGRILDIPYGQRAVDGEYFFAHSEAQQDEIFEAARAVARDGHTLYFETENYDPQHGVLIFPTHGHGSQLVHFCCAVLLPDTILHPAFAAIRAKAENW